LELSLLPEDSNLLTASKSLPKIAIMMNMLLKVHWILKNLLMMHLPPFVSLMNQNPKNGFSQLEISKIVKLRLLMLITPIKLMLKKRLKSNKFMNLNKKKFNKSIAKLFKNSHMLKNKKKNKNKKKKRLKLN